MWIFKLYEVKNAFPQPGELHTNVYSPAKKRQTVDMFNSMRKNPVASFEQCPNSKTYPCAFSDAFSSFPVCCRFDYSLHTRIGIWRQKLSHILEHRTVIPLIPRPVGRTSVVFVLSLVSLPAACRTKLNNLCQTPHR